MVLTGAFVSAAGAQSSDGSFMNSRRFMQRDGEVIYRTVCQGCHMAAAQGAVGAGAYPALANDAKLAAAGYWVLVVVNGSKGMPPFGALLDDEQVAAVVNYVRSSFRQLLSGQHFAGRCQIGASLKCHRPGAVAARRADGGDE
jgi:mono/diheme cytochrome c family protein